ncbi:MAG: HAD-IIIC family phosphatase [Bdellovibrionota bacterium]
MTARKERIAIAGNCSTESLSKVIHGYFADEGISLEILESAYDTVNLSVLDNSSVFYQKNISFLVLFYSPLKLRDEFYKSQEKSAFASEFISDFQAVIQTLKKKNITVLVTSLPTSLERCFGDASAIIEESLIFQLQLINSQIKKTVQENSHCHLLDIEYLANRVGLDQFLSEKLWSMGKYPCHTNYYPHIASHIFKIFQAKSGNLKKVLVVDLDNTLWNGMIGEDGIDGIEPFQEFQYYLKSLKDKGFLLTVCSKNDFSNAVLPFRDHPEMILKEEDIAVFIANWEPKSTNLRAISQQLNLGLDSFVFIDDSPFERNEIRHSLPEVLVPELSDDPTEYITLLDQAGFLENLTFSGADKLRTQHYQQENKRHASMESATSLDDYLLNLGMKSKVEKLNASNLERAAQLIQRSNQFNLRTQRLSKSDLERMASDKKYVCLSFSLEDKFGDSGMISVVICEKKNKELFIHELVMSCRVLKRGMEEFIFNAIIDSALENSLDQIKGEYIRSDKNGMVENLLEKSGFVLGTLKASKQNKRPTFIGRKI